MRPAGVPVVCLCRVVGGSTEMKFVSVLGVTAGDGVVVGCVPLVAIHGTLGGVVAMVEACLAFHSTVPCW